MNELASEEMVSSKERIRPEASSFGLGERLRDSGDVPAGGGVPAVSEARGHPGSAGRGALQTLRAVIDWPGAVDEPVELRGPLFESSHPTDVERIRRFREDQYRGRL